jgi:hypothetical protein
LSGAAPFASIQMAAMITAIVKGHQQSQNSELIPWNYADNV